MNDFTTKNTCPIWGTPASDTPKSGDYRIVSSPRAGGTFKISGTAEASLKDITDEQKGKLSHFILSENIKGLIPEFGSTIKEHIYSINPTQEERLNLLLKALYRTNNNDGYAPEYLSAIASSLLKSDEEYEAMFELDDFWRHAHEINLIHSSTEQFYIVRLTFTGRQYVEKLGPRLNDSEQIFVAMWFSDDTKKLFNEAIEPAAEAAGYQAVRIDRKEFNGKICDEILAEIRRSKAVLVDLTCGMATENGSSTETGVPRGGVYFEAGFAAGLGLPVIWTVQKEIADKKNVVHFDVRQYSQIRWSASDLATTKKDIEDRIVATLGEGPGKERQAAR